MSIRVRERSKHALGKSKLEDDYPEPEFSFDEGSSDKISNKERPVSTTLLQLISDREQASEQYTKADKAHRAYMLNRQATTGQESFKDAKNHFKETASHFKMGCKGLFVATAALPSIIGDNGNQRRQKSVAKRRQRNLEHQKKLQEELDKAEAEE